MRVQPPRLASLLSVPAGAFSFGIATLFLALAAGCEPPVTSSLGSGGCLAPPEPTFALHVLDEAGGFVPPDTTIEVTWSAGDEPPFHLDDPTTWGTLESSNVLCDVDSTKPPPDDLTVLACVLWTASPTKVRVSAKGYGAKEHTYTAEPMKDCEAKPTPIEIELSLDPH
jgi:hypothetical protein